MLFKKRKKGFTLIEVLLSIVIIGIIASGIVPVITKSLTNIYDASNKNKDILIAEREIQKGMSKKITFSGTEFPVKFSDNSNTKNVKGSIIQSKGYITFLADTPYIKINPFALTEGHKPLQSGYNPAKMVVDGYNTHFVSDETKIEIYNNKNKLLTTGYRILNIEEEPDKAPDDNANIEITKKLKNSGSPYTIKIITDLGMTEDDTEVVRAKLPVNLPRFLAAGKQGEVVVSAEGDYWSNHNIPDETNLYDVLWGNDKFISYGDNGKIYILENEKDWQSVQIDMDVEDFILKDGIYYKNDDSNIYEIISSTGTILKSKTGFNWSTIPEAPIYKEKISNLNNKPGLYFDDRKSINFDLNNNKNSKTIFLVLKPEDTSEFLFNMISEENKSYTVFKKEDNSLCLARESNSTINTGLSLENNQPYIITIKSNEENISLGVNNNYVNNSININPLTTAYLGYNFPHMSSFHGTFNSFKGCISEVIVYNKFISNSSVLNKIHSNLAQKYNITNIFYSNVEPQSNFEPGSSEDPNKSILEVHLKGDTLTDKSDGNKVYKWENPYGNNASILDVGLNAITDGSSESGKVYIAVGEKGKILRREDQKKWQTVVVEQSYTNYTFNNICWSSAFDKFFIVGQSNEGNGVILSSDEGIKWSLESTVEGRPINAIIPYPKDDINNKLIAVGDSDLTSDEEAIILSSTDGQVWNEEISDTMLNLNDITYQTIKDTSYFITVGEADTENNINAVILYSTNGQNWNKYNSKTGYTLNGVGR